MLGAGTPPDGSNSTAILLSSAANVTIDNNTITGAGTDIGIAVYSSTNVTISNNAVGRTAPDSPDPAESGSTSQPTATNVTLICNTFSGWQPNKNIVGAVQMSCTPLPPGTECHDVLGEHLHRRGWHRAVHLVGDSRGACRRASTIDPATGAITGTPTAAGTFNFTVKVADSSNQP